MADINLTIVRITAPLGRAQLLEPSIQDRILRPVLIIEVPPLDRVNREALIFHRPQQVSVPAPWSEVPPVRYTLSVKFNVHTCLGSRNPPGPGRKRPEPTCLRCRTGPPCAGPEAAIAGFIMHNNLPIYSVDSSIFGSHRHPTGGLLVNVLFLGGAVCLIDAAMIGFTGSHVILAAVVGSLFGAGLGGLILVPSDDAMCVHIARWEHECIEHTSIMVDARKNRRLNMRGSLKTPIQLHRSLLTVYLSRRNQLLRCRWPEMMGVDFENFLTTVFQELGYQVRRRPEARAIRAWP